jgi:hypothetical protein
MIHRTEGELIHSWSVELFHYVESGPVRGIHINLGPLRFGVRWGRPHDLSPKVTCRLMDRVIDWPDIT